MRESEERINQHINREEARIKGLHKEIKQRRERIAELIKERDAVMSEGAARAVC